MWWTIALVVFAFVVGFGWGDVRGWRSGWNAALDDLRGPE